MNLKEAWYLWRAKGKTMTGTEVTIFTVVTIAFSAFLHSTVEFFTELFWKWIWTRKKN